MASAETDEESTCTLCQEEIVDPVTLSCNHVFCSECIAKTINSMLTSTVDKLGVSCPLCRQYNEKSTTNEDTNITPYPSQSKNSMVESLSTLRLDSDSENERDDNLFDDDEEFTDNLNYSYQQRDEPDEQVWCNWCKMYITRKHYNRHRESRCAKKPNGAQSYRKSECPYEPGIVIRRTNMEEHIFSKCPNRPCGFCINDPGVSNWICRYHSDRLKYSANIAVVTRKWQNTENDHFSKLYNFQTSSLICDKSGNWYQYLCLASSVKIVIVSYCTFSPFESDS